MTLSTSLFAEAEEETLRAAVAILERRRADAEHLKATNVAELYRRYGKPINDRRSDEARTRRQIPLKERPALDGPTLLTEEEALLLAALERNKYVVEGHPGGDRQALPRWYGDAQCKHGVQEGAIICGATSRHDLLLGLWASVSGQDDGSPITLTEEHLQGSVVQQHLRELRAEMKRQEENPESEDGEE